MAKKASGSKKLAASAHSGKPRPRGRPRKNPLPSPPPPPPVNQAVKTDDEYSVEALRLAEFDRPGVEGGENLWSYYVKWQGYDNEFEDNTWEPETNLVDCDFLLNTFWRAPARKALRIAELPNIMVLEPALEDAIRESKAKPKAKSKSASHRPKQKAVVIVEEEEEEIEHELRSNDIGESERGGSSQKEEDEIEDEDEDEDEIEDYGEEEQSPKRKDGVAWGNKKRKLSHDAVEDDKAHKA